MAPLNLDEALSEALTFVQHEILGSNVALRVEQANELPVIIRIPPLTGRNHALGH
jgi:hypothetical protein